MCFGLQKCFAHPCAVHCWHDVSATSERSGKLGSAGAEGNPERGELGPEGLPGAGASDEQSIPASSPRGDCSSCQVMMTTTSMKASMILQLGSYRVIVCAVGAYPQRSNGSSGREVVAVGRQGLVRR